ncbi:hypothetical protein WEI85_32465 [Actinomycetes bacterium KLBMP 9797]
MSTVVDIANLISAIGTVTALLYAIVAYRVAKRQGSVTFELEVLRELAGVLRRVPDNNSIYASADIKSEATNEEFTEAYRDALSTHIQREADHLLALVRHKHPEELLLWDLCRRDEWNAVDDTIVARGARGFSAKLLNYRFTLEKQLRAELLHAIERRMD